MDLSTPVSSHEEHSREPGRNGRGSPSGSGGVNLTILFDNRPNGAGFPTNWGFACLVQTPAETLLMDTGSNGRILLDNARRLGVELESISGLLLSHPHWDHMGGLDSVLEVAPRTRLYLPSSVSRHLLSDLSRTPAQV